MRGTNRLIAAIGAAFTMGAALACTAAARFQAARESRLVTQSTPSLFAHATAFKRPATSLLHRAVSLKAADRLGSADLALPCVEVRYSRSRESEAKAAP